MRRGSPPSLSLGTRPLPPTYEGETQHVVFVLHGVGQKLEQVDIVRDVDALRSTAAKFEEAYKESKCEFIPIQWRKHLDLTADTHTPTHTHSAHTHSHDAHPHADLSLAHITPPGIPALRGLINDVVLDVMFYMSPYFSQKIAASAANSLNAAYREYVRRNPDFLLRGGKFSILAHSLGSVIAFDLLCNQFKKTKETEKKQPESVSEPEKEKEREAQKEKEKKKEIVSVSVADISALQVFSTQDSASSVSEPDAEVEILQLQPDVPASAEEPPTVDFCVNKLFMIGSPLGLFLGMRCARISGKKFENKILSPVVPAVSRIYNIFNKYDPVAYRLDPLVYSSRGQLGERGVVYVPYHKGGTRFHIQAASMKSALEHTLDPSAILASLTSLTHKEPAPAEIPMLDPVQLHVDKLAQDSVDFVLQDGPIEQPYLASVSAHLMYWADPDTALFLLSQLRLE
eukprot:TRINITY_DN4366_c0_g1_i1.p1 TRINITY_DN4366_c0_g1~~TRINITY_DN4366_c0_g1_i1.p1  ORF type:complete len:457 (-),score=133.29 TRINITY_DN4366_c0_g1_i1:77-1447(-)